MWVKILKNTYGANSYFLGTREITLIDTGFGSEKDFESVQKILEGKKLLRVFLTHLHVDHADGVKWLREKFNCQALCSEKDRQVGARFLDEKMLDFSLKDGATYEIEDGHLLAIATPGHSPGHFSFYEPGPRSTYEIIPKGTPRSQAVERSSLFCGDLVLGEGTTWVGPPYGNMQDYLNSLYRIQKLNFSNIYPGHGRVIENPGERISEVIEHRLMREREILSALSSGPKTPKQLRRLIYPDISTQLHEVAEITILGHLEKLIGEGRVKVEKKDYYSIC